MVVRKIGFFLVLPVITVIFFASCVSSYSAKLNEFSSVPLDPRLAEGDGLLFLGETGVFVKSPNNSFIFFQLNVYYSAKTDEIEIHSHFNKNDMALLVSRSELEKSAYTVLSGKDTSDKTIPLTTIFDLATEKIPQVLSAHLIFEPIRETAQINTAMCFTFDFELPFFWDKKLYVTQNQLERFFFLIDTETINTTFKITQSSESEDSTPTSSFDNFSDF